MPRINTTPRRAKTTPKPIRSIDPMERLPQHHAEVVGGPAEAAVIQEPDGEFRIQTRDHEYELDAGTPEVNIEAEQVFIIQKAVDPQDIARVASMEEAGVRGGIHSKRTFLVSLKDGSQWIYKQTGDEERDEIFAYRLSIEIFRGIVPETIPMYIPGLGWGSAQRKVTGIPAGRVYGLHGYFHGNEEMQADLASMIVMDYLIGNPDRHANNWFLMENDRLAAIDNGWAGEEPTMSISYILEPARLAGLPEDEYLWPDFLKMLSIITQEIANKGDVARQIAMDVGIDKPAVIAMLRTWEPKMAMLRRYIAQQSKVAKARVYIDSPQEAPEGAHVEEGPRGGFYYESEPSMPGFERPTEEMQGQSEPQSLRGVKFQEQADMMEALEMEEGKARGVIDEIDGGPDRGKLKDSISKNLAERTGLSYNTVNEYIQSWAGSSSDSSRKSVSMQMAAAELFNLEPTPYIADAWGRLSTFDNPESLKRDYDYKIKQQRKLVGQAWQSIKRTFPIAHQAYKEGRLDASVFDAEQYMQKKTALRERTLNDRKEWAEQLRDALAELADPLGPAKKIVRAIYEDTQEHLKRNGIKELILVRGMNWLKDDGDNPLPDPLKEVLYAGVQGSMNKDIGVDDIEMHANPLSSWAYAPGTAQSFASGTPEDMQEYGEPELNDDSVTEELRGQLYSGETDWTDFAESSDYEDLTEKLVEDYERDKRLGYMPDAGPDWDKTHPIPEQDEYDDEDEFQEALTEWKDALVEASEDGVLDAYRDFISSKYGGLMRWALDRDEEGGYLYTNNYPEVARALMCARVPAERIISTSLTGMGCLNENEIVVAGGPMKQRAYVMTTSDPENEALDWADAAQWDADASRDEDEGRDRHADALSAWAEENMSELMQARVNEGNEAAAAVWGKYAKGRDEMLAQAKYHEENRQEPGWSEKAQQAWHNLKKYEEGIKAEADAARAETEEKYKLQGAQKYLAAGWKIESIPDGWLPAAWKGEQKIDSPAAEVIN